MFFCIWALDLWEKTAHIKWLLDGLSELSYEWEVIHLMSNNLGEGASYILHAYISYHQRSSAPPCCPAPSASPRGIRLKEKSLGNIRSCTANPSLDLSTYFSRLMPPHGRGPLKICPFCRTFYLLCHYTNFMNSQTIAALICGHHFGIWSLIAYITSL